MWRETGFFNDDSVTYHFKEYLFHKKKNKQTPSLTAKKTLGTPWCIGFKREEKREESDALQIVGKHYKFAKMLHNMINSKFEKINAAHLPCCRPHFQVGGKIFLNFDNKIRWVSCNIIYKTKSIRKHSLLSNVSR